MAGSALLTALAAACETSPACENQNSAELKDWKEKDVPGSAFVMLFLKVLVEGKHIMPCSRSVPMRTPPWQFSVWIGITSL